MNDKFTSISAVSQGQFKDKGSRFIAYAYPVKDVSEVKPILEAIEKEHHAARHHCYAYRIANFGPEGELSAGGVPSVWRANDDGEPSGSAGKPILGQIDSASLMNVLVVVVRYFGGILLGVPGLIRAYRTATAEALAAAERKECTAVARYRLRFQYDAMPAVEKMLKDFGLQVLRRDFSEDCAMEVEIPLSLDAQVDEVSKKMAIFKDKI